MASLYGVGMILAGQAFGTMEEALAGMGLDVPDVARVDIGLHGDVRYRWYTPTETMLSQYPSPGAYRMRG